METIRVGCRNKRIEYSLTASFTGAWYPPCAETVPSAPQESSHLPPESAYFLATNRNKRSIGLNFKHPEGRDVLYKLVRSADVLVENFVTGKLASMGLGYEDCRRLNPRLIYASITGMLRLPPLLYSFELK
jgi:succinate---hydroxymethylglutarate CoA-transferase